VESGVGGIAVRGWSFSGLLLGALGSALISLACTRKAPPDVKSRSTAHGSSFASASASSPLASAGGIAAPSSSGATTLIPAEERTWVYESTPIGRMSVVVLVPAHRADQKLPVLLTMHGRGEAMKGPDRGARGWVDDYDLSKVIARLAAPPLAREDFKSFVKEERLARLNAALSEHPYRGMVIVCPYTPDMLTGDDPFGKAPPLARFLVDELLARVYRETPALGTVVTTAIDGVSLGGRAAYSVGLLRPMAFGVISGLQAAFHADHAADIAARAVRAKAENPGLVFHLLTSDDDFFLDADTAIARAMRARGVPVHFDVVLGPHDYDFNRGPGAIEMLLFHDRVLRGEPPP
jgi:enterochelin esterase-like enzyme